MQSLPMQTQKMGMMTMPILSKGFRSRAQLNMRKPRSVSYAITPINGGGAVHYGGAALNLTPATSHVKCEEVWRSWQNYHMDSQKWADIAYTGGYCQHGFCLAGRGFGVRTAANGSNDGNQNYYAFVFIGGGKDVPSPDAINALQWWINEARLSGKAGMRVVPHSSLFGTSCPGAILKGLALLYDKSSLVLTPPKPVPSKTVPSKTVPPKQVPNLTLVKSMQQAVGAKPDGQWGAATDVNAMNLRAAARMGVGFSIRLVQRIVGVKDDGVYGPISKLAVTKQVYIIQRVMKVKADGVWGQKTDNAFQIIRSKYLNKF